MTTTYATFVEKCRTDRINWVISNASIDHAAVLFENLFAAALAIPKGEPREMRIQCHQALIPFYSKYVTAARNVLEEGVDMKILVADASVRVEDNPFLQTVSACTNKAQIATLGKDADGSIDFVVVGNSAYRLEDNTETIQAVANFNDPLVSAILIEKFDENWALSVPQKTSTERAAGVSSVS
ncbi:MAG TPA: hypothetical protein VJL82_08865 [Rhizomicrobium sp.]|nr:hypothetical protein [Rhizomicrobium sp.]